jgi:hypothetical protein
MPKFLADENVPGDAVEAARQAGHDVAGIVESSPSVSDDAVLAVSLAQRRVLVTFGKDLGELVFRHGKSATCGVVLVRPRLRNPDYLARFTVAVLEQAVPWEGNFSVAREGRLRVVPLPD